MDECVRVAHALGERVWTRLGVPVYFYEYAARSPERIRLENVRRGGFEHPRLLPDLGGPNLHRSAGACCIGARKFLIAFNVNLKTADLAVARSIAAAVRESSGGLAAVKAMGVRLEALGIVQVSMNLIDFERTPLDAALNAVREQASLRGVEVAGTEIVGLVPRKAIEEAASRSTEWLTVDPELILENRLEAAAKLK
jgi:glutamate formiminotransferase